MTVKVEQESAPCTPEERKAVETMLDKATTVMMFNHELYTKFILTTKFVVNDNLPATMGIRPLGTHLEINYNPRMIRDEKLGVPDLVEILRHEYGHVLLHHVWSPLPSLLNSNIAGDIEINQHPWIAIEKSAWLSKNGCTPEAFKMKTRESREYYYRELLTRFEKTKGGSGKGNGNGSPGDNWDGGSTDPSKVDSHEGWDSGEVQASEEIWRKIVSEAVEEQKLRGNMPGNMYETITAGWKKVPQLGNLLRRLIARYIALSVVESDTRTRPNRRFQILPGVKEVYGPTIVWAIDTSGSMSAPELRLAFGVLRWVNRKYPVSIIQCDTAVTFAKKNVHKVSKKINMRGRGGTSFEPVFQFIKDQWKNKVDLLVFVTDMEGAFPETPPPYKTIWLSTTNSVAPFGKTIKLKPK